jgi:hypothetical protein
MMNPSMFCGLRSGFGYGDPADAVRRHSTVASEKNAIAMRHSPTTINRSTEPLCWSGSHPDTSSIQSGNIGVMSAKRPVNEARLISAQKRRR